jgi:hypothetical protein
MESGMARVISYDDQGEDHAPNVLCDCLPEYRFILDGSAQSHMTEGSASFMNAKNDFSLLWNAGWGEVDDTEYKIDLVWQRYMNTRWSWFAGARFTNLEDEDNRVIAGVSYRLPLMANLTLTADSRGDASLGLEKRFQVTGRLSAFGRAEYPLKVAFWSALIKIALTVTVIPLMIKAGYEDTALHIEAGLFSLYLFVTVAILTWKGLSLVQQNIRAGEA